MKNLKGYIRIYIDKIKAFSFKEDKEKVK